MLRSGNDAATAIAEHVGGSVDGFVYLMNEKAQLIGMRATNFSNPHGLDDSDEHYSTAYDMAVLTRYALRHPMFREMVKTKVKRVDNPHESWDYKWYNKNKLLSLYEGADGVKTGFTKRAKRCLVSSATRNNQQLVVVTLNDPADWVDHMRLFDYGFQTYPLVRVAQANAAVPSQKGRFAVNVDLPLRASERETLRSQFDAQRQTVYFYLPGQSTPLASAPLVQTAQAHAPTLWERWLHTVKEWFS
jgi:D-alanyl-D-alanine carboxypeptidase